jgi:putative ABC transport system permease protein
MIRLAYRNLFQNKVRLGISVGGVALALMLIFSLDAIFTGVEKQITAYIDNSQADIFVSQSGVRNMHMASSAIPSEVADLVAKVAGVETVTPLYYVTNNIVLGEERQLAYILGIPPRASMGKAWKMADGRETPETGEAVIGKELATRFGIGLGDQVEIMGRNFTIGGLTKGSDNLVNSVAFISFDDFAELRGDNTAINYLLVRHIPGASLEQVANLIAAQVPGVTVQSRNEFADQERQVVRDMGTDIIAIMNMIGFFIGLAVMGLTMYTAILTRRHEYGVLKALGASNRHIYLSVLVQAIFSVAIGFGLGWVFTLLLATGLALSDSTLTLVISSGSLVKVGILSVLIASFSAALPIKQISNLDPVMVFRGK